MRNIMALSVILNKISFLVPFVKKFLLNMAFVKLVPLLYQFVVVHIDISCLTSIYIFKGLKRDIFLCFLDMIVRSIRSQMFLKIGVLKFSNISQENTCVGVSFSSFFLQRISDGCFWIMNLKFSSNKFTLKMQRELK